MKTGFVNRIETMGLADGPGIRVVVFMQGCSLRCLYCHNPEMLSINGEPNTSPEDILQIVLKYKNYFGQNGGVTFSGGEPLLQNEFLKATLKLCKENKINTCLDTSGVGKYDDELLSYVDLVIFDIKAIEDCEYQKITGLSIKPSLQFLNDCQRLNKKMWIRSVIVPTINDTFLYVRKLADLVNNLHNIEKIELLPYHTMGKTKYDELNISYPLDNIKGLDIEKLKELQSSLDSFLK